MTRRVLRIALRRRGVRVIETERGDRPHPHEIMADVVFCDAAGCGPALHRWIRRTAARRVPVIALGRSGRVERLETLAAAIEAGASEFLIQPVQPAELDMVLAALGVVDRQSSAAG